MVEKIVLNPMPGGRGLSIDLHSALAGLLRLSWSMERSRLLGAVVDWGGIGDADGNVLPVTSDGIDALLSLWPIFEAFNLSYVSRGMLLDAEKKRLSALADWHFGGGDAHCAACGVACEDCPTRLNQPVRHDGWDMSAALALAHALGPNPMAAAELLPELEAVMVRRINEKIAASE